MGDGATEETHPPVVLLSLLFLETSVRLAAVTLYVRASLTVIASTDATDVHSASTEDASSVTPDSASTMPCRDAADPFLGMMFSSARRTLP
jgi:hypothetical protein